jgi:hypothetical protein
MGAAKGWLRWSGNKLAEVEKGVWKRHRSAAAASADDAIPPASDTQTNKATWSSSAMQSAHLGSGCTSRIACSFGLVPLPNPAPSRHHQQHTQEQHTKPLHSHHPRKPAKPSPSLQPNQPV